ncbi:cytochrome d ubiquinol oxidase subunit II [Pengzhenrongella frigida]|uniref:Cytochrome d ubiquinol oxidase subunit II n=1 Tax=Pengzhenrongella frigida TaxID=1259133 RepID=A0A4Q5N3D8_9MICO|nr:cytochrome d ubiquinol oxidase subunit II [Cellulomonas sp. HLT2-17]RYV52700.1 cytochrome d ubiquinol oxidase subunit II [Cellulomonas sp. HLT2-17]
MDLSVLWFLLLAVLWTGYLVLEGFDFGVGMLLKPFARNENERRMLLRTVGPIWDGNEVWLLTAGGATFAAFPEWYATMFSGFYLALLLILVALIVRICAFEWRQKIDDPIWRNRWDWAHTFGAWIPSVLWGVAFANLVQGMQIEIIDGNHQLTGGFFSLITPFTLLGGVTTAALFLTHGAVFLALKTDGEVRVRAGLLAQRLSIGSLLVAAVWAVWAQLAFSSNVFSWVPLVIAALSLVGVVIAARARREGWAFALNAVAIAAAVALIFSIMYPNVMPSSLNPDWSLTIAGASSSKATLQVMSVIALVMVPIVLAYQGWTLWVFRARLTGAQIGSATGLHPFRERSFENVDR